MLSFPSVGSTVLSETCFNFLGVILEIASPKQTVVYSATRSLTNCFVQAAISEGMKMGLSEQALGGIVSSISELGMTAETAEKIIEFAPKALGYLVSAGIAVTLTNTICPPKECQSSVIEMDDLADMPISASSDNKMNWSKALFIDGCGAGVGLAIQNTHLLV